MTICDICGKESVFEGLCWYSMKQEEIHLCRSHYMKWNNFHKEYKEKHCDVKPCTKEWEKMCNEEGKMLIKWMKESKP